MRTTRNSTGSPLHGQSTPQATGAMYTNRAWLTHFHALTGDLEELAGGHQAVGFCLLYTAPSPRDLSTARMPSSA